MDNSVLITLKVIDEATPELKKLVAAFDSSATSIKQKLQLIGVGVAAMGVAVVTGFAALAKSALNAADEMGDTAQKVGLTTESMSELAYAAKMNGAPLEQLKSGLLKLNQSMVAAQDDTTKQAAAFKYLGVNVKDASGKLKSSDAVFKEIAQAVSQLPDGVNKSAVAMDIFGKSGAELIPMLNSGQEGLKGLAEEAAKLGVVFSQDLAEAAGQFNDSLDKLGTAGTGVGAIIAKEMLPVLNNLIGGLTGVIGQGDGIRQFGEGVGIVFKFIVKAAAAVVFSIQTVGKVLGAIAAAAVAIFSGDFSKVGPIFRALKEDVQSSAAATKDFIGQMDAAPVAKVTKEVKNTTTAVKDYVGATKAGKEARDDSLKSMVTQAKSYQDLILQIQREIDGVKELTFAQQIAFEMEKGKYTFLNPLQKEHVTNLLKEAEAKRLILEVDKQLKTSSDNIAKAYRDVVDATNSELQSSATYLDILKQNGQKAADAWIGVQQAIGPLKSQVTLLEDLKLKATEASDTQGVVRYQEAIDQLNGKIQSLNGNLTNTVTQTADIKLQTSLWQEYIGNARVEMQKLDVATMMLQDAFVAGTISATEFQTAMDRIDKQRFDALKVELTDLQKMTATAAQGMQSDMSSFFFDAMQGKMTNLAQSFKNTLDRMVADMLASKLTDLLFGGASKASGQRSGGVLTDILGSVFGGFRADGGPVTAGVPYIVGERQAEVFIPTTNGTIAPSVSSALAGGGAGTNVSFNITAMDSQDVMRSMEKIKRPLADLISGTKRAYNK